MKLRWKIVITIALAMLAVWLQDQFVKRESVPIEPEVGCQGQCPHDRKCQDMCFKLGDCPHWSDNAESW